MASFAVAAGLRQEPMLLIERKTPAGRDSFLIEYKIMGSPESDAVIVLAYDALASEEGGSVTIQNLFDKSPLIASATVTSTLQRRGIGWNALNIAVAEYPTEQEFRYVAATLAGRALISKLRKHLPRIELTEVTSNVG